MVWFTADCGIVVALAATELKKSAGSRSGVRLFGAGAAGVGSIGAAASAASQKSGTGRYWIASTSHVAIHTTDATAYSR